MKPGIYWIGDLCYVMHDEWEECFDLFFSGHTDHGCNEGEFTLKDGRKFASYNTAYGDGEYKDTDGQRYGVDSGSIGCIRIEDINWKNMDNNEDLGHAVYFPKDFETSYNDGVITFGHVSIDTKGTDEEEDYED